MGAAGLLRGGWRWVRAAPAVPGYQPGATLSRVLREIEPDAPGVLADDGVSASLNTRFGADAALLRERVERHFLMHIVNVELVLRLASAQPARGVIRLHHEGTFRRGALAFRLTGAHDDHCAVLAQRVCDDPAVRDALLVLDQRRVEIVGQGGAWELRIEPFGGCDVVNRMPAMRRAIRLGDVQAQALRQAAAARGAAIKAAA